METVTKNNYTQRIISLFLGTTDHLLSLVDSIPEEQFNTVPFSGSWTPGEVADHILKFQSGLSGLFNGQTESTSRNPDEKEDAIKKVFLDYTIKMKSPDFILPSPEDKKKEDIIKAINSKHEKVIAAFLSHDPTLVCLDFELPGFGSFTILEWMYFIIYHTQRHVHQLEKIHQAINDRI